ncbi:hypothetical protein BK133_24720 [Paenibacillus sp. FSL H8-0548]|uniref:copper amine oxidase N-terminal domain-containing protein n=1 Tax=Paenibacillus sp. FSL H8-0548 TaxID=1920422 RepID=UPI00096D864E|nr:copper amine oxidase N-terminal domain-containing protein [Paenibacillus sp. FSL H8-0548]OMF23254.1 hypothetical protein BK133_24720 [Paenibacillus sp. FSL H8-0548]
MRKLAASLVLTTILSTGVLSMTSAASESRIDVIINNETQKYSNSPIIVNGSVVVPLRAIFESLDANLQYDAKTKVITAMKGDMEIILQIGSRTATVNGKQVALNQPGVIVDNSTYVPVRFVSEALAASVIWESKTRTVIIQYVTETMINEAIASNNLTLFKQLLTSRPWLSNKALELVIHHLKSAEWANAAVEAGANANHVFEDAVSFKLVDVVELFLEKGKVNPQNYVSYRDGYSYLSVAGWKHESERLVDIDSKRQTFNIAAEPSYEMAELLYKHGLRANDIDALGAINSYPESNIAWLDWLLSHGSNPNGETIKMVYLTNEERDIHFYALHLVPDAAVKNKLVQAAYNVTSWNPDWYNLDKLEILTIKYGASLEPLSQAEKDRLLYLAKSGNRSSLINILVEAGAK